MLLSSVRPPLGLLRRRVCDAGSISRRPILIRSSHQTPANISISAPLLNSARLDGGRSASSAPQIVAASLIASLAVSSPARADSGPFAAFAGATGGDLVVAFFFYTVVALLSVVTVGVRARLPPRASCHALHPPHSSCHALLPPQAPRHALLPPHASCHASLPPHASCTVMRA